MKKGKKNIYKLYFDLNVHMIFYSIFYNNINSNLLKNLKEFLTYKNIYFIYNSNERTNL